MSIPAPAIPLVSVLRAMRNALNSFSTQEMACAEWMTETMRELSRLGHSFEHGDDFKAAWRRLEKTNPLRSTLIEGYEQLVSLGYIAPWPSGPERKDRHRITEKGKQWAQSDAPVPNWGS